MKNLVSTILIFGSVILLVIGGAYVFQSLNGMQSINKIDGKISSFEVKDNASTTSDNSTLATDNQTIDNSTVLSK